MKVWLVTSSCMCDDSCGCGSVVKVFATEQTAKQWASYTFPKGTVSSAEVLTKFPYGL